MSSNNIIVIKQYKNNQCSNHLDLGWKTIYQYNGIMGGGWGFCLYPGLGFEPATCYQAPEPMWNAPGLLGQQLYILLKWQFIEQSTECIFILCANNLANLNHCISIYRVIQCFTLVKLCHILTYELFELGLLLHIV